MHRQRVGADYEESRISVDQPGQHVAKIFVREPGVSFRKLLVDSRRVIRAVWRGAVVGEFGKTVAERDTK